MMVVRLKKKSEKQKGRVAPSSCRSQGESGETRILTHQVYVSNVLVM